MANDKGYELLTVKLYDDEDEDIQEFFKNNPKTHSTKKALRILIERERALLEGLSEPKKPSPKSDSDEIKF